MRRLFVLILAGVACLPAAAAAPGVLDELNRELVAAVAAADGAVVTIRAESTAADAQKSAPRAGPDGVADMARSLLSRARLGTGFVFDAGGYILTTSNVVGGMKEVSVELPDGTTDKAEVRGSDDVLGVTVLKINRSGLKALSLGDSEKLQRGNLVIGIGNQEGLKGSVVLGMISGLDRTISRQTGMIQVSGAIGPGSSGAPIMDVDGRVVAVTSAMMSSSGSPGSIRYYGQMNEQLKEYLDRLRQRLDEAKPGSGASGAFRGALSDEQYMAAADAMQRAVEATRSSEIAVADTGTMPVEHGGMSLFDKQGSAAGSGSAGGSGSFTFSAPGAAFSMNGSPFELAPPVVSSSGSSFAIPINRIKSVLEDLKAGRAVRRAWLGASVEATDGGLVFAPVEGGPAERAGMKAGDRLVKADGKELDTPAAFVDYVSARKPGDVIELAVKRDNKTLLLRVALEERPQENAYTGPPLVQIPGLLGEPTITLSLHEQSIASVAKALSDASRRSIIVTEPEKITKKVTIELKNIPLENAIKLICRSLGCVYLRDGQAYVISPK